MAEAVASPELLAESPSEADVVLDEEEEEDDDAACEDAVDAVDAGATLIVRRVGAVATLTMVRGGTNTSFGLPDEPDDFDDRSSLSSLSSWLNEELPEADGGLEEEDEDEFEFAAGFEAGTGAGRAPGFWSFLF